MQSISAHFDRDWQTLTSKCENPRSHSGHAQIHACTPTFIRTHAHTHARKRAHIQMLSFTYQLDVRLQDESNKRRRLAHNHAWSVVHPQTRGHSRHTRCKQTLIVPLLLRGLACCAGVLELEVLGRRTARMHLDTQSEVSASMHGEVL